MRGLLLGNAVRSVGGNPDRSWYLGPSRFGRGLFAARPIAAGEAILQLSGRPLDFSAAVALGDDQCYCLQIGDDQYLDLASPGRYVNHSCCPNAGIIHDTQLIALVAIPAHAEIFYDYSTTMDEHCWTMRCDCRQATCRHVVEDFRVLPDLVRIRYLCLNIVQLFIARQFVRSTGRALPSPFQGRVFAEGTSQKVSAVPRFQEISP